MDVLHCNVLLTPHASDTELMQTNRYEMSKLMALSLLKDAHSVASTFMLEIKMKW